MCGQDGSLDGIEVAIAMQVVGQKIATLCPFIPTVDRNERWLSRMRIDIFPRHDERLFNIFRRTVFKNPRPKVSKAGIIIPPERNMGEIGDVKRHVEPLPLGGNIGQDLLVIPVDIGKMNELIMRCAVKTERAETGCGQIPA